MERVTRQQGKTIRVPASKIGIISEVISRRADWVEKDRDGNILRYVYKNVEDVTLELLQDHGCILVEVEIKQPNKRPQKRSWDL